MSKQAVIDLARTDLGYTEYPPNSNHTKYWEAYDPSFQGQPWCVACQWDWFNRAGERMAFFGGGKTASCTMLLRWYREQGLTVPVEDIQEGDLGLMNFHGGRDPEHVGLVVGLKPYGAVVTIEGNTSPGAEGSQDDGGCVALKTRPLSRIVAVCRPMYKEEEKPVDDISGYWGQESVEWAKDAGLVFGYKDGYFRPNDSVTRGEMCVILHRYHKKVINPILEQMAKLEAENEALREGRI